MNRCSVIHPASCFVLCWFPVNLETPATNSEAKVRGCCLHKIFCLVWFAEKGSPSVAQISFELPTIFLPQSPKWWDCRCVPRHNCSKTQSSLTSDQGGVRRQPKMSLHDQCFPGSISPGLCHVKYLSASLLLWCVNLLLMVMSPASQWHLASSLHDQMTWLGPAGNMKEFLRLFCCFCFFCCGISSKGRYFSAGRFMVACVLCVLYNREVPFIAPPSSCRHCSWWKSEALLILSQTFICSLPNERSTGYHF